MDPAAALLLLSLQPVRIDAQAAIMRGAFLPFIIPLDGLPAATRAAWVLDADQVPVGRRVAALMAVDRTGDAFRLVIRLNQPVLGDVGTALSTWATRERERLGLPDASGLVVPLAADDGGDLVHEAEQALATVSGTLPLPWPRWAGPLVLVGPDPRRDPIPGLTWLARPALPILRCNTPTRGPIASDLTGLALALCAPPSTGWPVWLRRGLAEACSRRAQGQPTSPRDMRRDRQAAGVDGLREVLTSPQPDPALAVAVCSPLMLPEHRQRFQALLDLLRNGASGEGALRVAYGWSLADLAALR